MSSWWVQNSHVRLAATAIISGSIVAIAIFGLQEFQKKKRLNNLKKDIPAWDLIDKK